MRAAGAEKVLRETASGARADRAQLRRVLGQLAKGDVLTVTRLDRLARSTRDPLNTLATITGKARAFVRGMTMGRHDDRPGSQTPYRPWLRFRLILCCKGCGSFILSKPCLPRPTPSSVRLSGASGS
jgi:Resolvase, N terminal domain